MARRRATAALVLAIAAVVLGALALYTYESTRTARCTVGASGRSINVTRSGGLAGALPADAPYAKDPVYLRFCAIKLDEIHDQAQAAYLAYGALVLLGGAAAAGLRRRAAVVS